MHASKYDYMVLWQLSVDIVILVLRQLFYDVVYYAIIIGHQSSGKILFHLS